MDQPGREIAPGNVRLASFDYSRRAHPPPVRGRRVGPFVLVLVLLVAGAATWSVLRSSSSSPTATIERLVDAANAGEISRALAGIHPEASGLAWPGPLDLDRVALADRTEFADALGFFTAVEGSVELEGCREGEGGGRLGGEAICRFISTDGLSGTIGVGPLTGSLVVGIESGLIRSLTLVTASSASPWTSFETWIGKRSPVEFERWLADDVRYAVNGVPLSWVPGRIYNPESGAALISLARGYAAEDLRPPLPLVASGTVEWVKSGPVNGPALPGSRIAVFAGGYAVLESSRLWLSTDGMEWNETAPLPDEVERLAGAGDRLMAIGSNVSEVWQTLDGATWSPLTLDNPDGIPFLVGDVATAGDTVLITSGHRAWVGEGDTFQPAPFPFTLGPWGCYGNGPPYAVAGADGGYVVLPVGEQTDRRDIWTSPTGSTWGLAANVSAFGLDAIVCDVAGSGGRFVAVGSAIWTSDDGATWTAVGAPGRALLTEVQAGDTGWAAAGGLGAGVWVSEDGTDWQPVPEEVTATMRAPAVLTSPEGDILVADLAPGGGSSWIGRSVGS